MASSSTTNFEFTAYHMKCINFFKWTPLGRYVIRENPSGDGFIIKRSPIFSQIWFFIYFFNTLTKLVFLSCMISGNLGPTEFLDVICGLDYFLCGIMVCLAYIIWQRYPLYEIIHRLWEHEDRIYRRLGRPREMKWEAADKHSVTLWAHAVLTGIGCCSLTLQFFEAPKYCVFTFSVLEADNFLLRVLFCIHEAIFLSHAWFAMSCCNGICSFESVNLTLILEKMSATLEELAADSLVIYREAFTVNESVTNRRDESDGTAIDFQYTNETTHSATGDSNAVIDGSAGTARRMKNSRKDLFSGVSKNYTFKQILYDYRDLYILSEQFNSWIGYKIVALSICGFCQYISSTTMAFQVLRMPGSTIGDIWFYIQDCFVAIYVTFRVFDQMSTVLPASLNFLDTVKRYNVSKRIPQGYIKKFQRTLRPVSLKLGPNPLRREAVLDTMSMLANYYVCVALW